MIRAPRSADLPNRSMPWPFSPGRAAPLQFLLAHLSQTAEAGLRRAVAEAKAETWKRENRTALDSPNAWGKGHGLPLDRFRQF